MRIELKNFKSHESLSEETNAYTATVWVNGVRAFEARNNGQGGCDDYRPFDARGRELLEAAERWAKTLPPAQLEGYGSLPMNLELYIGEMVEAKLREKQEKQLQSWCKKKTIFRTPDMPEGEYKQYACPYTPQVKAYIEKHHPNAEIINERFK